MVIKFPINVVSSMGLYASLPFASLLTTTMEAFTCKKCHKTFGAFKDKQKHQEDCEDLVCQHCFRAFKHKGFLLRHLRTVHDTDSHECKKCLLTFETQEEKERHVCQPGECPKCGKQFTRVFDVKRHLADKVCVGAKNYKCTVCDKSFERKGNLLQHERSHISQNELYKFACGLCDEVFQEKAELLEHRENSHIANSDFVLRDSAHRGRMQSLRADFPPNVRTVEECLNYFFKQAQSLITEMLTTMSYFKVNFCVNFEMYRLDEFDEVVSVVVFPFRTPAMTVALMTEKDYTPKLRHLIVDGLAKSVDEFLYQVITQKYVS